MNYERLNQLQSEIAFLKTEISIKQSLLKQKQSERSKLLLGPPSPEDEATILNTFWHRRYGVDGAIIRYMQLSVFSSFSMNQLIDGVFRFPTPENKHKQQKSLLTAIKRLKTKSLLKSEKRNLYKLTAKGQNIDISSLWIKREVSK